MASPELKTKTPINSKKDSDLKGTLASVFILGFVLVSIWIGVYALFVERLG